MSVHRLNTGKESIPSRFSPPTQPGYEAGPGANPASSCVTAGQTSLLSMEDLLYKSCKLQYHCVNKLFCI